MPVKNSSDSEVRVVIPWTTILKVVVAVWLAWLAVQLWPLAELLFLALLIAITLQPLVNWLSRRRWPRAVAILICALLLFGSVALIIGILVPTVSAQGGELIRKLPEFKEAVITRLPSTGPVRTFATQLLDTSSFSNPEPLLKQFVAWTTVALAGLVEFFVILVVALYFLADGERIYQWLLAFLPSVHRQKMNAASREIASVVGHYMMGQLITSVLCGSYAFVVLAVLHVPNPLLLAIMAAIFDILPLIGFFLFTIPAVALAFTVSPLTAVLVATLYGAYHVVENYVIVPMVYGDRLRLSTLTVLVSCLAAGLVGGVIGVIIVLPVVASYPIIERIWLEPYVGRETVQKHERLDHD